VFGNNCSNYSEHALNVWGRDLRGNYFVHMPQNGGCQTTFHFDESGAAFIRVARYNEYVNLGDETGIAFYSFYFYLTPYMLQQTVFCLIINRLRSFTPGLIVRI